MTTKVEEVKTDRRGFLKFAGIGTVGGGVALVSSRQVVADEATVEGTAGGYSETEHVKTFYNTARF